jgi:hypothetical protein
VLLDGTRAHGCSPSSTQGCVVQQQVRVALQTWFASALESGNMLRCIQMYHSSYSPTGMWCLLAVGACSQVVGQPTYDVLSCWGSDTLILCTKSTAASKKNVITRREPATHVEHQITGCHHGCVGPCTAAGRTAKAMSLLKPCCMPTVADWSRPVHAAGGYLLALTPPVSRNGMTNDQRSTDWPF